MINSISLSVLAGIDDSLLATSRHPQLVLISLMENSELLELKNFACRLIVEGDLSVPKLNLNSFSWAVCALISGDSLMADSRSRLSDLLHAGEIANSIVPIRPEIKYDGLMFIGLGDGFRMGFK